MHNKVNNVPKLRFPEFNKFLNKYLIGDLCDCIVPGRNKPKRFDGNIPWITTSDLKNNNLVYASKDNLNISLDEIKSCGAKIIPKHSVIMSCVGEFGLIAIAGKDIVINQQLHAFLPSNKLIENFALYSLMTKKFYMEKISTKTAVPYLNKNNCNSIPIYLPEKQEQQKIADFLSSIDNKLQALKQKQQLLQQYKKGMMQKLFFKQIRFKDENGQDYPEWESLTMCQVSKITMGSSPNSENYNDLEDGLPLIQGNADIKNRLSLPRIYTKQITKECFVGYILLTVRAPVGAVAKSLHDACIGRGICAIRVFNGYMQEYFYQYLLFIETGWQKYSQGSTFDAINSDDLKNLKINIPCTKEQQKIADFLSAIDKKIDVVTKQIEQTEQFKKGLLQQLFV